MDSPRLSVRPHGPDGTWDLYIHLADVAAEALALEAAGVPLASGPTDKYYPMREIECLDPDGYRICLAQDISGEVFRVAEVWIGALDVDDGSTPSPVRGRWRGLGQSLQEMTEIELARNR